MQVPRVWIECQSPDGHTFYHDMLTGTSHWQLNRPLHPPPISSIPLPSGPPPALGIQPVELIHSGGGAAHAIAPAPAAARISAKVLPPRLYLLTKLSHANAICRMLLPLASKVVIQTGSMTLFRLFNRHQVFQEKVSQECYQ